MRFNMDFDISSVLMVLIIVLLFIDIVFSFVNIKLRKFKDSIGPINIEIRHGDKDKNKDNK